MPAQKNNSMRDRRAGRAGMVRAKRESEAEREHKFHAGKFDSVSRILLFFCAAILLAFSTSNTNAKVSVQKRIDPHGTKELDPKMISLKAHKECSICHTDQPTRWALKNNISKHCLLCHLTRPHSGVAEHDGKLVRPKDGGAPEKMTCLHCHYPHRYNDSKPMEKTKAPQFKELARQKIVIPEGLVEKENPSAMIRRQCEECHSW